MARVIVTTDDGMPVETFNTRDYGDILDPIAWHVFTSELMERIAAAERLHDDAQASQATRSRDR